MKFILCISCIATLLMLTGIAGASEIATVHGIAYEWSTFEPLDNAIIEVNSTPAQSIVAKYGLYSFELPNGSYLITAKYYQDNALTYYGEEVITITDEGNYVLDLLLLPSYSSSDSTFTESGADVNGDAQQASSVPNSNNLLAGTSLIVIVLLVLLFYQIHHKNERFEARVKAVHKGALSSKSGMEVKTETSVPVTSSISTPAPVPATTLVPKPENTDVPAKSISVHEVKNPETDIPGSEEPEDEDYDIPEAVGAEIPEKIPAPKPSGPVPSDLQEILDILSSQGGRMTQKDMRKRLHYSEGKVSLMLLDLEKRGKIQKFKKGRGNVLFLVDEE
ncbi:hypothetical protein V7O66_12560 [Methanolobus sp. ZRKC3]|uniref:helix-turn-helix transcriptional regulator n=1 Tax=Methanolobus sp. ZRKC3 TaxID=3125786 RepID=UPI003251B0DF